MRILRTPIIKNLNAKYRFANIGWKKTRWSDQKGPRFVPCPWDRTTGFK
jgi:hypothetical protein